MSFTKDACDKFSIWSVIAGSSVAHFNLKVVKGNACYPFSRNFIAYHSVL